LYKLYYRVNVKYVTPYNDMLKHKRWAYCYISLLYVRSNNKIYHIIAPIFNLCTSIL